MGKKVLLEAQNINLMFNTQMYKNLSLRDLFINSIRSPADTFLAEKQVSHVLQDVSFNVHEGDRIGLIGVNGVGKTSLCRCLAKIYTPQSGHIIQHGSTRAVFSVSAGMFPELSGRENIRVLVKFLYPQFDSAEQKEILDEVIEFSELKSKIDAPYRTYSNGMQTRLGLSLISARPSDLLILDEVFDGADMFFREKIKERIGKIIDDSGAVIFVSHSISNILNVCNRVLFLHQGKLIFDGDPEEGLKLYQQMGAQGKKT